VKLLKPTSGSSNYTWLPTLTSITNSPTKVQGVYYRSSIMYLHSVREHAHSRVRVGGQEVEVYRFSGARVQDIVALLARRAVYLWNNAQQNHVR
jgi:hypothetical protein